MEVGLQFKEGEGGTNEAKQVGEKRVRPGANYGRKIAEKKKRAR